MTGMKRCFKLLTCFVDSPEKMPLINLAVLFCKLDLAFVGEQQMTQIVVSDQSLHCLH